MSRQCYAAGKGDPCDSARQRHHPIKKQAIRRVHRTLSAARRRSALAPKPWSISKALNDPRLWIWTCYRHHKEETAMPLPEGFWDAVDEYAGLRAVVPRWLHEAAVR